MTYDYSLVFASPDLMHAFCLGVGFFLVAFVWGAITAELLGAFPYFVHSIIKFFIRIIKSRKSSSTED